MDACGNGPYKSCQHFDFTLCCRIHPPEHFKEKYEVDEVHFVEEVGHETVRIVFVEESVGSCSLANSVVAMRQIRKINLRTESLICFIVSVDTIHPTWSASIRTADTGWFAVHHVLCVLEDSSL